MRVAAAIRNLLEADELAELRILLDKQHPADLADVMHFLSDEEELTVFRLLTASEAAEVLSEASDDTEANVLEDTPPHQLADILEEMPADEAADLLEDLPAEEKDRVLALADAEVAEDIRSLLSYPPDTAGGRMTLDFVDVPATATQAQALERFRELSDAEHIFYVYVVDAEEHLLGMVDLRSLLRAAPHTPVRELMDTHLMTVLPDSDQEAVAGLFTQYDLTALPVVDARGMLLGIITAEDIIDVLQEEHDEDVAQMAGSDAQELEHKSPAQIARLRLPWILATMGIELLAGFVVHLFDQTILRFVLIASFMPVISAISGNTGLQSAAIIIRGLSTGHVQLSHWRHAVLRQLQTTLLLGSACALSLGVIGALWDGHVIFGVVVFLGMFASINIAGVVGTVVPLISKHLGFDPALTAGPFETAFQDVVGVSIFLSLASVLLHWLR